MESRTVSAEQWTLRSSARDGAVTLGLADVVITTLSTLAVAVMVSSGRWVPGWWTTAATFGVIAIGPPTLRALAARFPGRPVFELLASFWLLPAAAMGHGALGPLIDAVRPRLFDGQLAQLDVQLFGAAPALFFARHVHGLALDALLASIRSISSS